MRGDAPASRQFPVRQWVAWFAGLYCLALVAEAPARAMAWAVDRVTGGMVCLTAERGSFWRGEAEVVLPGRDPTLAAVPLGRVQWRWGPTELLSGAAVIDVRQAGATTWGQFRFDRTGARVRGLVLDVPASLLAHVMPVGGWRPDGELHLEIRSLRWSNGVQAGQVDGRWRRARLGGPGGEELGSCELRLNARAGVVSYRIVPTEGPVRLSGGGEWLPGASLSFHGELDLRLGGGLLRPLIRGSGREIGPDRYRFDIDMRHRAG
ncbi:MAG: type II secretion system protein N [Betaproteobacteria bacterium]